MEIIDRYRKIRRYLLSSIEELDAAQLNNIPEGFNNNIVWHLGHVIAAQQGLCYKRAGRETRVSETLFETFKPGTRPEKIFSEKEIAEIKALALSTLDTLENDLQENHFDHYTSFVTRYGVELSDIKAAMDFVLFHEGLHAGFIAALKKLV